MASEIVERHRENHEYRFSGIAVDQIRKALVFGLCAAVEVDRIRSDAHCDAQRGKEWEPGKIPVEASETTLRDIADAMLWVEMTEPTADAEGGDA